MKIDQNIKDTIKASAIIAAVVILIVVGIGIYDAIANPEVEEIYGFITFSLILHDDLDEIEVSNDILNFADIISSNQIENPQEIDSALVRQSSILRNYKERFYILISPTDEMRVLKESLIEEGSLFLTSYYYLREALESNSNGDYDACLLNIEEAKQRLNDAMNLRTQNKLELDQWKMKIEAELSD
ncbi:MAG TPA: hypothetical protein G4O19_02025 [Dehalococcoidia bacterium]|nr:hypothetical protein [Dehalococcoidia bacterium]